MSIIVQFLQSWCGTRDHRNDPVVHPANWVGPLDDDAAVYACAIGVAKLIEDPSGTAAASIEAVRLVVDQLKAANVNPTFDAVLQAVHKVAGAMQSQAGQAAATGAAAAAASVAASVRPKRGAKR